MKLQSLILLILTDIKNSFTSASSHSDEIKQYQAVGHLMREIVVDVIPQCDLILLNDEYFVHWMIDWFKDWDDPVYTLTLGDQPFSNNTLRRRVVKSTGYSQCSTIIVACLNVQTCRTSESPILFQMLQANGILKLERRSFLFIESEKTERLKEERFETPETKYALPAIASATKILEGLNSHITLIRKYTGGKKSTKYSQSPTYQLLTWTPNWIPGERPLLVNIWSGDKGFWKNANSLKIQIQDLIKPGGVVRYCTASRSLLPMIQVNSSGHIKGIDAELINIFAKKFQFTPVFYEPKDKSFGKRIKRNGTWSGVIGEVLKTNADFGIGQIIFTSERYESGIKVSAAILTNKGVVVCSLPEYLPKWWTMLAPFETSVWVRLLIFFPLALIVMEALQRALRRMFKSRDDTSLRAVWLLHSSRREDWLPWINMIQPVFQRSFSTTYLSRKLAFMCVLGAWLLFAFLLSAIYSTVLIGVLSFPPRERPINSLKDLLNSDKSWSITGLVEQLLSEGAGVVKEEIIALEKAHRFANKSGNDAEDNLAYEHAIENHCCLLAEKGRALFQISRRYSVLVNNHPRPLLRVSPETFLLGPTGWAMRGDIDFILQTYLDLLFLHFRASGLLAKIGKVFAPRIVSSIDKPQNEIVKALGLETIQVIFYFLLVGLLISLVVFLSEILYYYCVQQKLLSKELKVNSSFGKYTLVKRVTNGKKKLMFLSDRKHKKLLKIKI